MPRLIAVDVVLNVVVGIWMLSLAATTMVYASSSSDGQLTDWDQDATGIACPRLCSCLGNVIDCSEKSLQTLFPIPVWVENL